MGHKLNKANIYETPQICMPPVFTKSAELKGMLLSKALSCMKFSCIYKNGYLIMDTDTFGYIVE